MITIRPLNPELEEDHSQLSKLMEEYVESATKILNRADHATWLKKQFKEHKRKDFMISAKFEDDEIVSILVGYKLEVKWGRSTEHITDVFPYWYMGLLYFKNKQWRSPLYNISELSDILVRNFERQGYYKMYMVKKTPHIISSLEDANLYSKSENWLKLTPGLDRYTTTIEKIFNTQKDIDDFKRFTALSSIIPLSINKSVMLLSLTLNPNTPLKV
jgi:hypothetical protein